jgi:hypothetical protein
VQNKSKIKTIRLFFYTIKIITQLTLLNIKVFNTNNNSVNKNEYYERFFKLTKIKDIHNIKNMLIGCWPEAVAQLLEHLNTKVRSRVRF